MSSQTVLPGILAAFLSICACTGHARSHGGGGNPAHAEYTAIQHAKQDAAPAIADEPEVDIWEDYVAWKAQRQADQKTKNQQRARELNETDFPTISASTYERDKVVVFVIGVCGAVQIDSRLLMEIAQEHRLRDSFVIADTTRDQVAPLLNQLATNPGIPLLLVLERGTITDVIKGAHDKVSILQFLARNDLVTGPKYTRDFVATNDLKHARNGRFHNGANFEGLDLRGVSFIGGSVSGSNFRGADLRRADLRGTILARADFTGANLTDAQMADAIWTGATCPDGTQASANPERSCEDHLTPRLVYDSSRD